MGELDPHARPVERFTKLYRRKFRREQGFLENQMNNWMVRETIQHHCLEIPTSHPPGAHTKDAMLEFIAIFEPSNNQGWIRRNYYTITPSLVAKALRCGHHHKSDKQMCKEWIKDYSIKVVVRALGESMCYDGQAKWKNKKDKF